MGHRARPRDATHSLGWSTGEHRCSLRRLHREAYPRVVGWSRPAAGGSGAQAQIAAPPRLTATMPASTRPLGGSMPRVELHVQRLEHKRLSLFLPVLLLDARLGADRVLPSLPPLMRAAHHQPPSAATTPAARGPPTSEELTMQGLERLGRARAVPPTPLPLEGVPLPLEAPHGEHGEARMPPSHPPTRRTPPLLPPRSVRTCRQCGPRPSL